MVARGFGFELDYSQLSQIVKDSEDWPRLLHQVLGPWEVLLTRLLTKSLDDLLQFTTKALAVMPPLVPVPHREMSPEDALAAIERVHSDYDTFGPLISQYYGVLEGGDPVVSVGGDTLLLSELVLELTGSNSREAILRFAGKQLTRLQEDVCPILREIRNLATAVK
jgi:hypothetical protein